jgi:hypothetical protein
MAIGEFEKVLDTVVVLKLSKTPKELAIKNKDSAKKIPQKI